MSYDGPTPTKFGQYRVAEPMRLDRMHVHRGQPLKTVDHEPPLPVLDQEDLLSQGIDTSQLIPGARKVDALGSCTCNAGTVHLAERWHAAGKNLADIAIQTRGVVSEQRPGAGVIGLTADAVQDEKFAILLYHLVTDQTGNPATEWPPTDCGSTGLYVCQELESQGLISNHLTTGPGAGLLSLLQGGSVMQGTPFFYSWMEPDRLGFIDGDGGVDDLTRAIKSGVAGGHETCITAIESLKLDLLGRPDADKTVLRVRNSWSASFGDHGSFRIHLSTLEFLAAYVDFKQVVI